MAWASPVCAGRGVTPHPFVVEAVTCVFAVVAGCGCFWCVSWLVTFWVWRGCELGFFVFVFDLFCGCLGRFLALCRFGVFALVIGPFCCFFAPCISRARTRNGDARPKWGVLALSRSVQRPRRPAGSRSTTYLLGSPSCFFVTTARMRLSTPIPHTYPSSMPPALAGGSRLRA